MIRARLAIVLWLLTPLLVWGGAYNGLGLTAEVAAAEGTAPAEKSIDPVALELFEKKIRPLLVNRCHECHSDAKQQGSLRLDSRAAMLAGGDQGPVVVPGDPAGSLLIEAVGYGNEDLQMPPKSKLPAEDVAALTEWINLGAPWPGGDAPSAAKTKPPFDLVKRRADHWAWRPIQAVTPPAVTDTAWPRGPIDRFILAKLEGKGIAPSAAADRATLVRRAYFDIIGLPPTPEQVAAFVADTSPGAWEKVVDELLASPHFGERWGRHWLDLVRYAETHGHEFDYPIENAWKYRDYVVRALNADVPYDQFVREHLAGDLLPRPRMHPTEQYNESVIGTGFWFFGEANHAPVDAREDQATRLDNQIDVFSKAFLGLTIACARCHDHKFDAIATKDFYAIAGFLKSSRRQEALLDPGGTIAKAAGTLQTLRATADASLSDSLRKSPTDGATFAKSLLAARRAALAFPDASKPLDIKDIAFVELASSAGLEPADLAAWVIAVREAATRPEHPLFGWAAIASVPGELESATFASVRSRVAEQLTQLVRAKAAAAEKYEVFARFSEGKYGDWTSTGEAFGSAPTKAGAWDSVARGLRAAEPGIAHSGQLGGKLQGVLRSPTFTITKKNIHYRVAGEGAQIRLIIDGYFMDQFSALLFAGAIAPVDTKGQYVWHNQGQDIGRYIGHRAHIELIDRGSGYVAVDEIRFSDDGPSPTQDNPIAASFVARADVTSLETLAAAYGAVWADCVKGFCSSQADAAQVELVNWAVAGKLIKLDPNLQMHLAETARQMDAVAQATPDPQPVLAMADGTGEDEQVHIRGSHKTLGEVAPRRMLVAIAGENQPPLGPNSGRLELAERLLDESNPFPARAMANRVWHHLFGRGIVATVDNFGVLGQPPSHPELLDYLAESLRSEGWSIKRLVRGILLSSTYQMASTGTPAGDAADPENLLLHRMNVRRLEGEAIRDAILAVSGRLNSSVGGASVDVHLTPFMDGRGRPAGGPLDGDGRRSIYTKIRRNFLPPMMLAYDMPIPFNAVGRRTVSNVPAQALILLNDPLVVEQARLWANRVLALKDLTPQQRIERMYREAFARGATDVELAQAQEFLAEQGKLYGVDSKQALGDARVWTDLGHVLWNVKEFIYIN